MSEDLEEPAVETVEETLHLEHAYAYGDLGARFFEALRDGERFLGARCPECAKVMVPPEPFCSVCFVDTEEDLVEVGPGGTLDSWTRIELPFPGQPTEPPYIWAFVKLDGADTALNHILAPDVDAEDVEVGMRLVAEFEPAHEREGKLRDVAHFRPGGDDT